MSVQSITSDEFQRFQDQLISLKEAKYRLEEKNEALQRQYNEQTNKLINAEREIVRLNEFKNRTKNSRDIDVLINENETLRERFTAIESNFKLQTEVLKSECENLLSENHRLKSQLDTFSKDGPSQEVNEIDPSNETNKDDDKYQIRLLQIEITKMIQEKNALQHQINEYQATISDFKVSDKELSQRVESLLSETNKHLTTIKSLQLDIEKIEADKSGEISKLIEAHESNISKIVEENDKSKCELKLELEDKYNKEYEGLKIESGNKISDLNVKIDELNDEINSSKVLNEKITEDYENKLELLQEMCDNKVKDLVEDYESQISSVKNEKLKLEDDLSFVKEELKVVQKKNAKLLRDMKKQLEKEVKLTQDTQSKLAEAIIQRGTQLSNQNVWSNSRGQLSNCGADDTSSVYSWSNNGILSDSQNGSNGTNGGNIAVTDDELKTLLDKVAESQSELGETKRIVEIMEKEKKALCRTIDKQQKIIDKYINRSHREPLAVDGDHDKIPTGPDSRSHRSTSSSLVLNGVLSRSPEHDTSSVISRVKSSLRAISNEVLLQTTASGGGAISNPNATKVTKGEVKQLQRVCEELMMRCLNLESDLQAAIDLNVHLQQAQSDK